MSLYLKYRPQDFSSVVGQQHVVTTLQNALKHGALTHAYLFCGSRGTGKTSMARILAKAINCLDPQAEGEPCNVCDICVGIGSTRLVDLIEIDAASNRGIDEIRELREKIMFSPTQAKSKVYIIDEVHMLTKEAFNALLKTLEEPPSHAYFILATTEAHKIPETILSRCQQFTFKRIEPPDIVKRLQKIAELENVEADTESLELIGRLANGALRDAIGLFEQMTREGKIVYEDVVKNLGLTGPVLVESFFRALMEKNAARALELINEINAQGGNLHQFTGEVIAHLREQMLLSLAKPGDTQAMMDLIDIFSHAKEQINVALIPQLPVEMAILRACDFRTDSAKNAAPATRAEEPKASKSFDAPAAEPESALSVTPELTLTEIKSNWQRIMDHIETPFIRMSFNDGEPVKFERGTLHLEFKSASLKDKVASTTNQGVILRAFDHVFKTKVSLQLEMKKLNLKPMSAEAPAAPQDPSVLEMAKEIFGA